MRVYIIPPDQTRNYAKKGSILCSQRGELSYFLFVFIIFLLFTGGVLASLVVSSMLEKFSSKIDYHQTPDE